MDLPRLLYIGDVPIATTVAGAALLYRLLKDYPREKLVACAPVTGMGPPLAGVRYVPLEAPWPRILKTRLSPLYCSWVAWRSNATPGWLRALVREFRPEAVLTISQASAWLMAWRLAQGEGLPLLLFAHDDYAFSSHLPARMRPWAERMFADAYRAASVRFCISDPMAEAYQNRYGVPGQVLYPVRDPENPVFESPPRRLAESGKTLTFAYAGSIHGERSLGQIVDFAREAQRLGSRLIVYSPQHDHVRRAAGAVPALDARPPIPSSVLLPRLREEADCLLATAGFDSDQAALVATLFPSKVADYSAIGLPLIVWGPEHASIVRFVREHAGFAEVVTSPEPQALSSAISRLAESPELRTRLAMRIIEIGRTTFSPEAAASVFVERLLYATARKPAMRSS